MIVSSLIVSGFGLTKFNLYRNMPHLLEIASTMIFLLGPLFYFYVKVLTQKDFILSVKMYLHFTPFLLLLIYLIPFYIQDAETKLLTFSSDSFSLQHRIIIVIQIVHVFIYMYFIKKLINQHVQKIKNSMSSIEKINLKWIKTGINVFTSIFGIIAVFLFMLFIGIKIHPIYSAFIPSAVSFTIISMGFIGLKQPIIFPPESVLSQTEKYKKSTLTDEQANQHLEALRDLMKNNKLYLRSDLTLQKLAENLSITPHFLSQIINEKTNQNFFDFINSYRVEEAKQLLASPRGQQLTILAIGEEAGFNSKSSFNSAFKKHSGMTPTQFRQTVTSNN